MKAKSTFFMLLLFLLGGASISLSAQEYSKYDVAKVKVFLRQGNNLTDAGMSPTDTLNWDASTDWINSELMYTPLHIEWYEDKGISYLEKISLLLPSGGGPYNWFSGILDVNDCKYLKKIEMISHGIKFLDATNCPNLEYIDMSDGKLAEINIENSPNIRELKLSGNYLNFTKLPRMENLTPSIQKYEYSPQGKAMIMPNYLINTPIDFSYLGATSYTWFDSQNQLLVEGEDYSFDQGKTIFLKETTDRIRCEMTNDILPDLNLITTNTSFTQKQVSKYNENDKEKLYNFLYADNDPEDEIHSIWQTSNDWVWQTEGFDWKIEGDEFNLHQISTPFEAKKKIDFSNCKYLTGVKINSPLYEELHCWLNLSGCSNLINLNLAYTSVSDLKLEGCDKLENINCRSSFLTFKNLPNPKNHPNLKTYIYSPQNLIGIAKTHVGTIDLNHTGGSLFSWIQVGDGAVLVENKDYKIEDGVSYFYVHPGTIYCEIKHPDFPDLTLTTTQINDYIQSIDNSTLDSEVQVYSHSAGAIRLIAPFEAQYTVYNLMGKIVAEGKLTKSEETINVQSSGVHMLRVEVDKETVSRKVMVQ